MVELKVAMHHPIIHILMALHLAAWSPAFCCCAIKSALGQATCREAARQALASEPANCCMQQVERTGAEALSIVHGCCSEGMAEPGSDPSPADCRCHERTDNEIRLDTGGKVSLPNPAVCGFIAVIADSFDLDRGSNSLVADLAGLQRRAHPPPRTLLAQHCLLLI